MGRKLKKIKKKLFHSRFNQQAEFLFGNIFLVIGGALNSVSMPLAAFSIMIGLFLDYRVFFQTLYDIEETQKEVDKARSRLSTVSNSVFSMNSDFDNSLNTITTSVVRSVGISSTAEFASFSMANNLEDAIHENSEAISRLERRISNSSEENSG